MQLRSDHRVFTAKSLSQNNLPQSSPLSLTPPPISPDKHDGRERVESSKSTPSSNPSSKQTAFGRFFGSLGKEAPHEKKNYEIEKAVEIHEKGPEKRSEDGDLIHPLGAFHDHQSTVVAMITPDPGLIPVSSSGGPNESTRMMEVLDFIEVCICVFVYVYVRVCM